MTHYRRGAVFARGNDMENKTLIYFVTNENGQIMRALPFHHAMIMHSVSPGRKVFAFSADGSRVTIRGVQQ